MRTLKKGTETFLHLIQQVGIQVFGPEEDVDSVEDEPVAAVLDEVWIVVKHQVVTIWTITVPYSY
jgi:hypothetical protein